MEILKHTSHSREEMMQTGVYKIYHTYNINKIYVGSAASVHHKSSKKGFLIRWSRHLSELKHNKHANYHLQKVVNKYGIDGIRFQILEVCAPDKAESLENFYIKTLESYEKGYNITRLSKTCFGRKHRPETIEKIKNSNKGRKQPSHVIEASRKASIGRTPSNELKIYLLEVSKTKKTTYLYNLNGELLQEFKSAVQCDRFLGLRKGRTSEYIKYKTFIKRMYFVSYENLSSECIKELVKNKKQIIKSKLDKANKSRLNKKIPC